MAEILGAVLAPLNSKVAPVFSKLTLHMVQFGPYNWVNLIQKIGANQFFNLQRAPFIPHAYAILNDINSTYLKSLLSRL